MPDLHGGHRRPCALGGESRLAGLGPSELDGPEADHGNLAVGLLLVAAISSRPGLVDRLEAKGLVERQAHPTDRRVKALVLTPSGRTVRARLRQMLDQPPSDFDRLDAAELSRLRELLARLAGDDAPRTLAR